MQRAGPNATTAVTRSAWQALFRALHSHLQAKLATAEAAGKSTARMGEMLDEIDGYGH